MLADGSQIILLAFFIFLIRMFLRKQNPAFFLFNSEQSAAKNEEHFSEPPAKLSEGGVGREHVAIGISASHAYVVHARVAVFLKRWIGKGNLWSEA